LVLIPEYGTRFAICLVTHKKTIFHLFFLFLKKAALKKAAFLSFKAPALKKTRHPIHFVLLQKYK